MPGKNEVGVQVVGTSDCGAGIAIISGGFFVRLRFFFEAWVVFPMIVGVLHAGQYQTPIDGPFEGI
ncbi:MAG: hypothetical protein ACFFGZ_03500 [Candidatus Thorarchaeota archaeon]